MKPFKLIFDFGWKFFVIYTALFIASNVTGCYKKVRDFYANSGGALYENLSSEAEIKGLVNVDEERGTNVLFQIYNKKRLDEIRKELMRTGQRNANISTLGLYSSSRTALLMPLILLISLIFAYHSSWKRKGVSLLLGIPLVLIYSFFKIGCSILHSMNNSQEYFPDYQLSSFTSGFLEIMNGLIVDGAYIIVVIIWFLVCVRFEDFEFEH